MEEYFASNRANWDDRAGLHAARDGSGYNIGRFVEDRALLSDVVRFDIPLLPSVEGLRGVHLQCHIGTDTLSLARRGAHMTGLDFSAHSIREARALVAETGDAVSFVEANVYDARDALDGQFDLVFTGIGAIGWLPDITRWADVVASLLAPSGVFFIRECHPIVWTIDEASERPLDIHYPYWEHEEPLTFDDDTTYVDTPGRLNATRTYEWAHSLGEIVTALADAGLRIDVLAEHDSMPWEGLPGQMVQRGAEWVLADRPERLPLTFSLRATKG